MEAITEVAKYLLSKESMDHKKLQKLCYYSQCWFIGLEEKKAGRALPFTIVDKKTNTIIGSTRYCNAIPEHKRLEIGYTWYAKSHQRTSKNTETKLVLLTHAFENLQSIAVEFRTHHKNKASINAIARLGAKQDGILRQHQQLEDGSYRDSVVFSILNKEWSAIKKNLKFQLESYA